MSDAMREAITEALSPWWDDDEADHLARAVDAVLAVVRGVDADEAKALLRDAGRFMFHRDMCRWPEVCTCGLAEWREQLALYRRVVPVVPAGEPCGYCDGSGFLSDPVQICGDCMGKGRVVPPRKAGLRRVPSPERWDIDADGHGLPPRIARVPVMNSAVVTPQQSMPPVTPRNILGFLRTLMRRHQPPKGGGVMTCPRCGSTDPWVCRYIILAGAPHPHGSRLECCPDPFHQQEAQ